MAHSRTEVRRGDVVIEAGTVRTVGTEITAGKLGRAAACAQGAFALVAGGVVCLTGC